MLHTVKYKNNYIHFKIEDGQETIQVQLKTLTGSFVLAYVKSYHAAKMAITRHEKENDKTLDLWVAREENRIASQWEC